MVCSRSSLQCLPPSCWIPLDCAAGACLFYKSSPQCLLIAAECYPQQLSFGTVKGNCSLGYTENSINCPLLFSLRRSQTSYYNASYVLSTPQAALGYVKFLSFEPLITIWEIIILDEVMNSPISRF